MYKYFKELECPDKYGLYIRTPKHLKENKYKIQDHSINELLISKELFDGIEFLDMITTGINNSFSTGYLTSEEYINFYDFLSYRDENYWYVDNMKKQIDLSIYDLDCLLNTYLIFSNYLAVLFPSFKVKIEEIKKDIKNTLKILEVKQNIILSDGGSEEKFMFPNAWFITPSGYLYNTGGKDGHKEGNLIYPFHVIKQTLYKNKDVINCDTTNQIVNILKRGYVTQSEFTYYANLIGELPTIITPEIELEIEKYQKLLNLSEEEYLKIPYEDFPNPKRSYQSNIIKLVIGHLAAEKDLYDSFRRLNVSNKKAENMKRIEELTNSYMPDILIRYAGFNKIESMVDKTICSSSLNSIDMFKDYLDIGWTLQLIPGIVYDSYLDKVDEVDFNSYFIEYYLDKKMNEYNGNGKILVKKV